MRRSSVVAALMLAIVLVVGASHARHACSLVSSHVRHCGGSHDASDHQPPCCGQRETAPLVSRLESVNRAHAMLIALSVDNNNMSAVLADTQKHDAPPLVLDRAPSLRLHLILATLIV